MSANQPVVPTFTIAFEGLMLFHGGTDTTKTDVAIVDSADGLHKAVIYFRGDSDEPLRKGDVVRFSLAGHGGDTDGNFERFVVSLDEYTRLGGIHDNVLSPNASHDGVFARVVLPSGNLTTYRTFPTEVRLRKWIAADDRCFPRYVLLGAVTTTNTVTVTITGPGRPEPFHRDVDANGCVLISNGCTHIGSHFHEYDRMLSTFGWLASVTLLGTPCRKLDAETSTPRANRDVIEFLNDRYPNIPNGDCGPIRP